MEKYLINPNQRIGTVDKNIYGHFSEHLGRCIYEGIYVGKDSPIPNVNGMRKDVVNALKEIKVPVLRWPGGCFADEYHWKDGIGTKEERKKMINTHWGGLVEDNSFGTHEFFELCEQLGCEPYICGNVGSGTVQEMSEWVEYMTFDGISPMAELRKKNGREKPWDLKYFGVGNENWGCGGHMTAEHYADEFKRYATYVRSYDKGNPIYKIACGPNALGYEWTDTLMKKAGKMMSGLSFHYYTGYRTKGATEIEYEDYCQIVEKAYKVEKVLTTHCGIMDRYDEDKRVGLIVDEWGTWYKVEPGTNPGFLYQQNTMCDAIVAGLSLNIFNKHCDRVKMTNIAQMVNVLQAMVLTDGEDMLLTPTYYVYKMYREHQNSTLLGSYITSESCFEGSKVPQLVESASMREDGTIISTVVNTSVEKSAEICCQIADHTVKEVKGEILTGEMLAHNTFEDKENVTVCPFTDIEKTENGFKATIPPCSIVKFEIV